MGDPLCVGPADAQPNMSLPPPDMCVAEDPPPPVVKKAPPAPVVDAAKVSYTGKATATVPLGIDFTGPPAAPSSVIGTNDYYQWRHDDFKKRHPGKEPPDYYLNYGGKYCLKFTTETSKDLSPAGQKWVIKARYNLQTAIEAERKRDPVAFDKLEQDPEAFRKFAYGTHAKAYLDAGVADIPYTDLLWIGMTPEFKDLFTIDGISQALEVGAKIAVDDVIVDPLEKTAETAYKLAWTWEAIRTNGASLIPNPYGPSGFPMPSW